MILQILAITLISFGIAHPMFTLPSAAYEYVFILDTSASMHMEENGQTRFDKAKAEIQLAIEEATGGSRYTLVLMGGDTIVIPKVKHDTIRMAPIRTAEEPAEEPAEESEDETAEEAAEEKDFQ